MGFYLACFLCFSLSIVLTRSVLFRAKISPVTRSCRKGKQGGEGGNNQILVRRKKKGRREMEDGVERQDE
jgi:hypothetical protein